MAKYLIGLAISSLILTFALLPQTVDGRVQDTVHNLNISGPAVPNGEVCRPCHAPHHTDPVAGYLWNHELTTQTFTVHDGATSADVVNSTSRLCLSCHDGTVAIDSYGGGGDSVSILPGSDVYIGTDLTTSHPVGVTYPAAGTFGYNQPDVDGNIVDAVETPPGSSAHLEDGKVQCVSCHFAHGSRAPYGMFLRIDNTGSALCMTCHVTPG